MTLRTFAAGAFAATTLFAGLAAATGAQAALTLPPVVVSCAGTLEGVTATCAGFYEGNLLNGGNIGGGYTNNDMQLLALQSLGYAGDLASVTTPIQKLSDLGGADVNFTQMLYGVTYIGLHFGGAGPGEGKGPIKGKSGKPSNLDTTGFFRFDAGTDGIDVLGLNFGASSAAVLYSTGTKPPCVGAACGGGDDGGVPEPATWLMMIMGFGGMGAVLRRRRRHAMAFA